MDHEKFIDRIMDLDENIRFATIFDFDGNQKVTRTRKGVVPYLTPDETKDTLKTSANAWKSRMKHSDKIGKGLYILAVYEKLRRVTVPLKDSHLLLVTIDNKGGRDIIDRILNQLYGDYTKY
ncbi:MAG: hypothetical protein FJ356_00505 [Thaumarchaeota archaeon]|nr:hypothetical protein [Nitrososphaerota archaeon]